MPPVTHSRYARTREGESERALPPRPVERRRRWRGYESQERPDIGNRHRIFPSSFPQARTRGKSRMYLLQMTCHKSLVCRGVSLSDVYPNSRFFFFFFFFLCDERAPGCLPAAAPQRCRKMLFFCRQRRDVVSAAMSPCCRVKREACRLCVRAKECLIRH